MSGFVGRRDELATLERLYASERFEMLVLYGRRRVGKTSLLEQFCIDKKPLWFTAQVQSNIDNLRDFSRVVYERYGLPSSMPASTLIITCSPTSRPFLISVYSSEEIPAVTIRF